MAAHAWQAVMMRNLLASMPSDKFYTRDPSTGESVVDVTAPRAREWLAALISHANWQASMFTEIDITSNEVSVKCVCGKIVISVILADGTDPHIGICIPSQFGLTIPVTDKTKDGVALSNALEFTQKFIN